MKNKNYVVAFAILGSAVILTSIGDHNYAALKWLSGALFFVAGTFLSIARRK